MKKRTIVVVSSLVVASLIGVSTLTARRGGEPRAPVVTEFAAPRFVRPPPAPRLEEEGAVALGAAGAASEPRPIKNLAELDRYLESLILFAQLDPNVAGDQAEEGVALMNSLVDELGGPARALEKEKEFTDKLQKIAESEAKRPKGDSPVLKGLLAELQRAPEGEAREAFLAKVTDELGRVPPEERGYWIERLKQTSLEARGAPGAKAQN